MEAPDWKRPLGEAFDHALAYLEGLPARPVTSRARLIIGTFVLMLSAATGLVAWSVLLLGRGFFWLVRDECQARGLAIWTIFAPVCADQRTTAGASPVVLIYLLVFSI